MKPTATLLALLLSCACFSQSSGPFNGSNFVNLGGGNQSWSNTVNIASSDDVYATTGDIPGGAGAYSDFLVATGFDFDLPDGVTIFGIQVDVERSDPSQLTVDHKIQLVIGDMITGENRGLGQPLPATDSYTSYGGSNDLWGAGPSYKDIENNNFGVAISVQRKTGGGTADPRIDNIRITVYYAMVTLPVNLLSFNVSKANEVVKIEWNVETESEIARYDVERSSDGIRFSTVSSLAAKNINGSSYRTDDYRPYPGPSHYRLKIVSMDGSLRYSSVASINFSTRNDLRISPSPWSNGQELFISNTANEQLTIRFFNSSGDLIMETGTRSRRVETRGLEKSRGMIYYKVLDPSGKKLGEGSLLVN